MEMQLRDRTSSVEDERQPHASEDYLCWSRMHAESGEDLSTIIARKERERLAGNGLFFWGVGNAPALIVQSLARLGTRVPVVFSLMKGKPKSLDLAPPALLVWRSYFDLHGVQRPLPQNVLVTSRATTESNPKRRHFALMCFSQSELRFTRGIPFDPTAYRNAGGTGAAVGSSQVTALLKRVEEPKTQSDYEENIRADLVGSLWVKLSDPIFVSTNKIERHQRALFPGDEAWTALVSAIRAGPPAIEPDVRQGLLF